MFDVTVITPEFKDISLVKQHRLINDVKRQEPNLLKGTESTTQLPKTQFSGKLFYLT